MKSSSENIYLKTCSASFSQSTECHFCSPLSALFRGCWKSAAPAAADLILEEGDDKCQFVVDNPLRRDRVVTSPVDSEDTTKSGPLPEDLPESGIKPTSPASSALTGGYFTTSTAWVVLNGACSSLILHYGLAHLPYQITGKESADGSYGLGWSPTVCICKMKAYLFIFLISKSSRVQPRRVPQELARQELSSGPSFENWN